MHVGDGATHGVYNKRISFKVSSQGGVNIPWFSQVAEYVEAVWDGLDYCCCRLSLWLLLIPHMC